MTRMTDALMPRTSSGRSAGLSQSFDERQPRIGAEHRGVLFSAAYRMLGSVSDAEDMVQDAFLRWQRASESDIESPKAFLITIVSRLCINR